MDPLYPHFAIQRKWTSGFYLAVPASGGDIEFGCFLVAGVTLASLWGFFDGPITVRQEQLAQSSWP